MPYGNHMQGQRTNLKLLRKISMFKKGRRFLNTSKEEFASEKGEFKTTKKGKYNSGYHKTKSKIQEGKRKEKDKILIALSIFAFLLLIVVFLINKSHQDNNKEHLLQQQQIDELNNIDKINEYAAFIEEGDIWIGKKNWHNAIFRYSQAVELFPAKYESNYRLILAYSYNCAYTNKDCEIGNELNNKFLKLFPEDENLIELEQLFKDKL